MPCGPRSQSPLEKYTGSTFTPFLPATLFVLCSLSGLMSRVTCMGAGEAGAGGRSPGPHASRAWGAGRAGELGSPERAQLGAQPQGRGHAVPLAAPEHARPPPAACAAAAGHRRGRTDGNLLSVPSPCISPQRHKEVRPVAQEPSMQEVCGAPGH